MADQAESDLDGLIERLWGELSSFPEYAVVGTEELRRSAQRNALRLVAALRGHSGSPVLTEDETITGRARAAQGVPVEAMIALSRAVYAQLRDAFFELSMAYGLSTEAILEGARRWWRVTDELETRLLTGHQDEMVRSAALRESVRVAYLTQLLRGETVPEQDDLHPESGIRRHGLYRLVCVRNDDVIRADLARMCRTGGFEPCLVPMGTELIAVTEGVPRPAELDYLVLIGGPCRPDAFASSYRTLSRMLMAAEAFGLTGPIGRRELSFRLEVFENTEIGQDLTGRFIAPVRTGRSGAEILATVETYLRNGRRTRETAVELHLHVNTVRYRLDRFAELTGADLDHMDTVFEIWWALTYQSCREAHHDM